MGSLRLIASVLFLLTVLLPGQGVAQEPDPADGPTFVAHDVEPVLANQEELGHVLRRVYPSGYRDTGLDVTALLWVYVARDGSVGATQVLKSTGYDVFDRAAEQVANAMSFDPALKNDEPIAVWVQKAIKFDSGDSGGFLEGPALVADDVVQARDSAKKQEDKQ